MVIQAAKARTGQDPLTDATLLLAGLLALLALSDCLERTKALRQPGSVAVAPTGIASDLVVSRAA
jgi:hypothetical protein